MRIDVDTTHRLAERVKARIEDEGMTLRESLHREGFSTQRDFMRAYKRLRRAGWQYQVLAATFQKTTAPVE